MIILSRLNGEPFALNCDLLERVDSTPDTILTLTDSTKYVVAESLDEVVARVRDFRASVLVRAGELQIGGRSTAGPLRLVPVGTPGHEEG